MKEIILASKSPRRRELMQFLNADFKVVSADVDETFEKGLSLEDALMTLANKKAMTVFKDYPNSIVIGADSIVYQYQTIFNKPKDKADAFSMIKSFSNNHHKVMTAVSIVDNTQQINFISQCKVYFNPISDEEIYEYLLDDEYKDKAGAYAIQGIMSKFIYKVEGDFYSVVGFPIAKIYEVLSKKFNIYK